MSCITKISAIHASDIRNPEIHLQVCAYCRVSTDEEDQLSSFVTQVDYYTRLIKTNSEWEFAGVYADEGISGTTMWRRTEFNRMIEDCRRKKIDLILTKSISRFARNVFESITMIRELKALGIAVYFEKERINTMTAAGELALTVYCSVAEEESASISRNLKWGIQKRMLNGTWLISSVAYGYRKDIDGELIVYSTERVIIERIYDEYLSGIGCYLIANGLNNDGIPSPRGISWDETAVLDILKNVIYVGDLLCQKTFIQDGNAHKRKRNRGECSMYLYPDDHEAIISRDKAELVKNLMEARRSILGIRKDDACYQERYPFSSRLKCGECGHTFKRQKIKVSKDNQYIRWCCSEHIRNIEKCSMTGIKEICIEEAFVRLTRKLHEYADIFLEPLLADIKTLRTNQESQMSIKKYNDKILGLKKQSHVLHRHMSEGKMDSALFMQKILELKLNIQYLTDARDRILALGAYEERCIELEDLIRIMKGAEEAGRKFDGDLFVEIIESAVFTKENTIVFHVKGGVRVTEQLHLKKIARSDGYAT